MASLQFRDCPAPAGGLETLAIGLQLSPRVMGASLLQDGLEGIDITGVTHA